MAIFQHGYALIIGVGADLPNTIDDAAGLASILQDEERCSYVDEHVTLLTAEEATRDNILSALDRLAQQVTPESTVIVFFSGHGYRVTSGAGNLYYLMPYGYDIHLLHKTAIGGAEFAQKLRAIRAQKLLLLLDCCHAGGISGAASPPLGLAKVPVPPEAQELFAKGSGWVLIASSTEDEVSYAGKPYSAFTLALIEALCGVGTAIQDGYVRVADLALHARETVPQRTQKRQHPILNFEQADNFILAYYAGGETQLKALPFEGEANTQLGPTENDAHQNIIIADQSLVVSGNAKIQGDVVIGSGKIMKKNDRK